MRQFLILVIAIFFTIWTEASNVLVAQNLANGQNLITQSATVVHNKDKFEIKLINVSIDSLKKIIDSKTNYRLYYRLEKLEDSLILSLQCNNSNIQQELTTVLAIITQTI